MCNVQYVSRGCVKKVGGGYKKWLVRDDNISFTGRQADVDKPQQSLQYIVETDFTLTNEILAADL